MITFDFICTIAIMLCILVCVTVYVIKELSWANDMIYKCKMVQEYCEEQLPELKDDHLKTNPEQNYKWNIEPEGEEKHG